MSKSECDDEARKEASDAREEVDKQGWELKDIEVLRLHVKGCVPGVRLLKDIVIELGQVICLRLGITWTAMRVGAMSGCPALAVTTPVEQFAVMCFALGLMGLGCDGLPVMLCRVPIAITIPFLARVGRVGTRL